jgi:hypothetical protein
MNVLGHQYFARSLRENSQIKFKGNMAPTVAKFGPTLKTGVGGTAGTRDDGSPAAAKRQKTGGSAKLRVSSNFDGLMRCSNSPRGEARSNNPQTAVAAFGERSPEVIPSDEEPNEEEQGLTGGAACAKAFANNDLVSEVIERHVPMARAFGAKAPGESASEVDTVTPAMAAAAQVRAIKLRTGQGSATAGSRSMAPGEVVHLTQSGEESGNKEEDFAVPPEETLAEELPHSMSSLRARMAMPGTTAWRFAVTIDSLDAEDEWAEEYGSLVARLLDERTAVETALSPAAKTQTYLALTPQANTFIVLHRLHRWTANPPSRSVNEGRLMAFEGETLGEEGHDPPDLMRFEEEEGQLFKQRSLKPIDLDRIANFYNGTFPKWDAAWFGEAEFDKEAGTRLGRLIPIPTAWAALFLDYQT